MIRISALQGLKVLDAEGKTLGRLHEIRAVDGRVTELVYGSAGMIERLTGKAKPTTIAWSDVVELSATAIRLK